MLQAIVPEGNGLSGHSLSIEGEQIRVVRFSGESGDGDVIHHLPVAVVDFEGRPSFRQTGGRRCVGALPQGHWQTSTFIAALRAESLTAPFLIEGAVNAEVFLAYFRQVLCPELRAGDIVILDNLSTHKTAGVTALISAHSASVRYLPAYSPDLNPIELAFAKLKSHLRQAAARTLDELQCALTHSLLTFSPNTARASFAMPAMRLSKSKTLQAHPSSDYLRYRGGWMRIAALRIV